MNKIINLPDFNSEDVNQTEVYKKCSSIEKYCSEIRRSIAGYTDINGRYFRYDDLATKIMFNDIAKYMNEYKDSHASELIGTQYYHFSTYSLYYGKGKLALEADVNKLNLRGSKAKVNSFPRKTIFRILDIEDQTFLTKNDYDKFLEIRKDPEYIKPHIEKLINFLYEIKLK